MVKLSVTLPDSALPEVEAAAQAAGKSVSAYMAAAATAAARRDAAARFRAALAANPEARAEHDEAVAVSLAYGRRTLADVPGEAA
jgi:hypothetical protein